MSFNAVNKIIGLMFLLCVALALAGCSKSDNSTGPGPDPAAANQRVSEANQIFIPRLALLIQSGGTDTASMNFASATALYREALTDDPSNMQAHFGLSLTEVLSLQSNADLRGLFLNVVSPKTVFKQSTPAKAFQTGISKEKLASMMIGDAPFAVSPLKLFKTLGLSSTHHPPSYYQGIIETSFLPVVNDALAHLNAITADQSFAFYITPAEVGSSQLTDSVRIDLVEVYALISVMNVLKAFASAPLAYNVDFNTDSSTAAGVTALWQVSSSFLQFRTGGAGYLHDTRAGLVAAAQNMQNAISFLENETAHPGISLITYNPDDAGALAQINQGMDSIKYYLGNNAVTINITDNNGIHSVVHTAQVNFYNLFENPISNIKSKVPAYTPGAVLIGSSYYTTLTWQAASFSAWVFPDPTFNGFFPGMTDAGLKNFLGITSNGWQQTVTLK